MVTHAFIPEAFPIPLGSFFSFLKTFIKEQGADTSRGGGGVQLPAVSVPKPGGGRKGIEGEGSEAGF